MFVHLCARRVVRGALRPPSSGAYTRPCNSSDDARYATARLRIAVAIEVLALLTHSHPGAAYQAVTDSSCPYTGQEVVAKEGLAAPTNEFGPSVNEDIERLCGKVAY